MRAAMITGDGGLENLHIVDVADPGEPGAGEIRVRVHATSLNYHDLAVATSKQHRGRNLVPMSDGAGVVESVGSDVTRFVAGDHVVSTFFPDWQDGEPTSTGFARVPGDGIDGFAQEIVVRPASAFTRAPRALSHSEAATITTAGVTAWRALVVHGGLKPGDSVLTLGTGGVSIWALQIARAMGARVIVTSSSNDKLERAKGLGATDTVNYVEQPEWEARVLELTDGRGVDHVVENSGSGTLGQSISSARVGGHVALVGVLTGDVGANMRIAIGRQVKVHGFLVGSNRHQSDLVAAIDAVGLRPAIHRSYPLEQLTDAFRSMRAAEHVGKITVQY